MPQPSELRGWVSPFETEDPGAAHDEAADRVEFREVLLSTALESASSMELRSLRAAVRKYRKREGSFQNCLGEIASLHERLGDALWRRVEGLESPDEFRRLFADWRELSRRIRELGFACAAEWAELDRKEQSQDLGRFAEFSRTMRHELRDTLGSAFTSARLLQEVGKDIPDASWDDVLESIPRNVQRAIDLLEGVQLLFASMSDEETETTEVALLGDVLRATIAEVSERAGRAGVDVEITGPLPLCWVDAGRTRLILHNLVGNAVKYRNRSKDERWVVIRTEEAQTGDPGSGEGDEGRVVIRIEDTGVGISRAEQKKVFDHFYRGQAGDVSGSGLGLAIARGAARQMGGDISLDSRPGRGCTFTVTVPTKPGPDERVHSGL